MSSVLNWFRKLDLFNGEFFPEEVLAGTAIPGGEERGRVAGEEGEGGGEIYLTLLCHHQNNSALRWAPMIVVLMFH